MNNVSINSNKILNFKSTQEQMLGNAQVPIEQYERPVELPQIYNIPQDWQKKTAKEKVKKWDAMELVTPWLEHPLLTLGTCLGLSIGVDKFAEACGGSYSTSLVGRAANLGDKIENSKFIQSKPSQTFFGWIKRGKDKIIKLSEKSDLLRAVRKTPSQPEWMMPKSEMLSMEQHIAQDFTQITGKLNLTNEKPVRLIDLKLDKTDKEFIKKFFKDTSATEEAVSNAVQLKRIGVADDVIKETIYKGDATALTKKMQLDKMGIDLDFLHKIEKNAVTKGDIKKIREACKNAKNIAVADGNIGLLGKFQPLAKKMGLDEIGNRLVSMGETKTKTGKALATFLQKCYRGLTFGGGKTGVIIWVAPTLVQAICAVKKADSDEKVGTLAHGIVNSISWVFTFPIAMKLMHRIGGMQYAGMSPKKVAEMRKLINDFNTKANPHVEDHWYGAFGIGTKKPASETFKDFNEYKLAKAEVKKKIKALKTVKDQSLLTKIGRKIGSFMTLDLEILKSYRGGSVPGSVTKNIPNFLRNLGGVPMRFAIWSAISMSVLEPIIEKGLKLCFGNFYDRFDEEGYETAKAEQKKFTHEDLRNRLYEAQAEKIYGNKNKTEENTTDNEKNDEYQAVLAQKFKTKMNIDDENQVIENEQKITDLESDLKADNIEVTTVPEPQITNNLNNAEVKPDITQDIAVEENKIIEENEIIEEEPIVSKTEEVVTDTNTMNTEEKIDTLGETIDNYSYIPKETAIENAIDEKIVIDNYSYIPNQNSVVNTIEENTIPKDNYTYIPKSDAVKNIEKEISNNDSYSYIPSSENIIKNQNTINKYIPSQHGIKVVKTFDNSALNDALRRAERAEKKALQILAGNFES